MRPVRNILARVPMAVLVLTMLSCSGKEVPGPAAPVFDELSAGIVPDGVLFSAHVSPAADYVYCGFMMWYEDEDEDSARAFFGGHDSLTGTFSCLVDEFRYDTEFFFYAFMSNGVDVVRSRVKWMTVPSFVDLGLSVNWAVFNVGGAHALDKGGIYQWGGTADGREWSISSFNASSCPYHEGMDHETGWTRYVPSDTPSYWSGPGTCDGRDVLMAEDDAANLASDGKWRMPTREEFQELVMDCSAELVADYNGTGWAGVVMTSKVPGYTDRSIFLPMAGKKGGVYASNVNGYYWSSSVDTGRSDSAYALTLQAVGGEKPVVELESFPRFHGLSVRAVCPKR